MEIDKAYKGREHSLIKHKLLEGYLETLLSIIGTTGKKEIVYVDCFAGPWGDDSESLSGTSIAISLGILEKVRDTLINVHKIHGVSFQAIYVEKVKKQHKRLAKFLEKNCPDGITCHALRGDYSELQDEILRLCGDKSFAFFFIDPKGWTDVSITKLTKLLRRPRSEFLITFMYDFLNRAIGMADYRKQVSGMLGKLTEPDYQELERLSSKERAEWAVHKYREQLKMAMGSDNSFLPRSFHADVFHKDKNRVHYHLVYLTRHHKGIVKFAEASEKVDFFQRVVRIQKKRDAATQNELFSTEEEAAHQDGTQASLEDVKNYWLEHLTDMPTKYDEPKLADILEETGWLVGDLEAAFIELLAEKKVENLDAAGKRTKHPVHFNKGERIRRCV